MNIYISIELSARELDGRLLLAVIAASKGHTVLVGDKSLLFRGARSGALAPGVFHKKASRLPRGESRKTTF